METKVKILLTFFIVILIFTFLFLILGRDAEKEAPDLDEFAKCLSSKGIIMYGTYWCPHCQNEKVAFGNSFQFVNYVECTEHPNECLAKNVDGYPTWIFPDPPAMTSSGEVGRGGRKLTGEQGITKLQEISGCPL